MDICSEFSKLVSYRQEFNEKNYDSLLKTGAQDWYSPTGEYEIKETDTVRDPKTVHDVFETPNIEELFLDMLKEPKFQSDIMALQQQFYYVAENENAFRRRHTTVPKMLANRMEIKAIPAFFAEDNLVRNVVETVIETGKQQLDRKRGSQE